ncbi:MAG: serine hydrolase domain-containing protein [Bacteroidia bacterium]
MKAFTILVALLATIAACGQSTDQSPSLESDIDTLFAAFDNVQTPGYAVGVSKGTETLFTKGYGAANLDYEIPITPQSAFSIASVSKQFTAACLALLIRDGELTLEDPVGRFIPRLYQYKDTILVKHLVYNTSGLQDYYRLPRPGGGSWITFNYFDIDDCIDISLSEDTLRFTPGTQWDYCNVNFMLLVKIIERASGMPFDVFAKARLFEPIGMNSTIINVDATEIIKNRVTPYNIRSEEAIEGYGENGIKLKAEGDFIRHPRISPHYGGSGVVTTIEDLLSWSKNMVSKRFGGERFYDLLHQTPTFPHGRNNQSFGLYHGDFNGRKIVAWDGGDWGISAQILRFPEQGIAIVVLSNLGTGEAFRKAEHIADILVERGIIK